MDATCPLRMWEADRLASSKWSPSPGRVRRQPTACLYQSLRAAGRPATDYYYCSAIRKCGSDPRNGVRVVFRLQMSRCHHAIN